MPGLHSERLIWPLGRMRTNSDDIRSIALLLDNYLGLTIFFLSPEVAPDAGQIRQISYTGGGGGRGLRLPGFRT